MGLNIVAFSGGKDSTALALRLHEIGEDFTLLFTPTGDELPELAAHISLINNMVNKAIIIPKGPSLYSLINLYNGLPNWRQRWCTRQIKIEPCIAFLKLNPNCILNVGLRADEESREGLYGPYAKYRYPLREWGWGIEEVQSYLSQRGVKVPARTDCALCYGQRLAEWWKLWKHNPVSYARGELFEASSGHTFRSPQRDTWPAGLKELRMEFESGRRPRGIDDDEADSTEACRVCKF